MCKDLQENKIIKMKFHEEIDQFIEQFWQMIMNRGGRDLKTTNYGEHFTFCNPELTSKTCACFFLQIVGAKAEK